MIDTPHLIQTTVQLTAAIRFTIPRDEIRNVIGPGIRELMTALATQGIAPAGAWLTHHLQMDPEVFDFEICVPVATPVAAMGRVKPAQLPATQAARTIYHGSYDGLASAWEEFDAWIEAHGHTPAAELWECYVAGPESNPDPTTWCTELNRPLIS